MPKSRGRHKLNRLTNSQILDTSKVGRHGDGLGLYFVVTKSGSKQWVLRIHQDGKRRDIGLGGYPTVSLRRAREKTLSIRRGEC